MNLIALFLAVIALELFGIFWELIRLRKVLQAQIRLRYEIQEGADGKERLIGVA